MAVTRKDATATMLTALAVLAYLATHQGWNVWLIGGSHRWAAGAIFALGGFTCAQGRPAKDKGTMLLGVLGALALGLAIVAVVTGSLTPLSLLVADIVALWLASTVRHAVQTPHVPVPH
jgi:hypothetical protein